MVQSTLTVAYDSSRPEYVKHILIGDDVKPLTLVLHCRRVKMNCGNCVKKRQQRQTRAGLELTDNLMLSKGNH